MIKIEASVEIYKENGIDISCRIGKEEWILVRSCGPYSDFVELHIKDKVYHVISAELFAAIGRCSRI